MHIKAKKIVTSVKQVLPVCFLLNLVLKYVNFFIGERRGGIIQGAIGDKNGQQLKNQVVIIAMDNTV